MVMVFYAQEAITPGGSPVAAPIPVAPVVVCVIAVISVFTHSDGVEEATDAVLSVQEKKPKVKAA